MRKNLLSLALVLAMALTLAPAALAAGQFTDVPDTSPFAAPIAWAVGKQITNGTTSTTFGPKNTCTTSHILTFLWRANGRPGDAGDEKAAVTAWANGLGIDTSDLNAPCTRANAVTYMWKAAGSPAPAQTASFTDVAADAPYASAVSWAVEQDVTKGTSDTAFSPYDTCTRGQIVTFLCRQLDPEAAKAQPAAPAQPEAPAAQANTPEAALAAIQGVWREDGFTTGNVFEYLIEGNTYTYMWRSGDGKERQYASAPFKVEGPDEKGTYYLRVSDGGLHPYITYKEGEGLSTSEYGLGTPASKLGLSDTYLVCAWPSDGGDWNVWPQGHGAAKRVSQSLLAEGMKDLKDAENRQQTAVSKYATYADFPGVPDLGAMYDIPVNNIVTIPGSKSFYYSLGILGERDRELYPDFRSSTDEEYRKVLEECGFTLTDRRRSINSTLYGDYTYRGNGYAVLVIHNYPTTKYVSDYLVIQVIPDI